MSSLSGPQFLLLYAVVALVLIASYALYASMIGNRSVSAKLTELTADPYRIVFLRADRAEAVRVALVNLVDRGLLQWTGKLVAKPGAADLVRSPLDKAILKACAQPREVAQLKDDHQIGIACDKYCEEMRSRGLLLEPEERMWITGLQVAVIGALVIFAGARILKAVGTGRPFGLLALFAIAAVLVACVVRFGPASPAGRRHFSSLKILVARLRLKAAALARGGATNEALLVAAVYGVHALAPAFGWIEQMFPRKTDGGSSCGSSCGSSSCGGGCGGGGCGGCGG